MFVETTLLNAHKALNSANYSYFTVQHSGAQSNSLQDSVLQIRCSGVPKIDFTVTWQGIMVIFTP